MVLKLPSSVVCSVSGLLTTMAMLTYLVILFIGNLHVFVKVDAQNYYCFENGGNYTEPSGYQMNLQSFLDFAPFNLGYRGFFNYSAGPTDSISGIALCRADLQLQDCENCVQNATDEIVKLCQFRRQAILWRENCTLRFSDVPIESLPLGVFADPLELQHLVHRGAFTDAAVFGDTDLEVPAFFSNQSVVAVHMSISSKLLSEHGEYLEASFEIPLHARYPALGQYFSRVVFKNPPRFFMCCSRGDIIEKECSVISSDQTRNNLIWEIPCGVKEHASVVSAVTFGFAIVAALVIVATSVCYVDGSRSSETLKTS